MLVAGVAALLVITNAAVVEAQRDTDRLFDNASHHVAAGLAVPPRG